MNLINLPDDILLQIFKNKINDIYNNTINYKYNIVFENIINLRIIHTTCKLFKNIVKEIINYLYYLNKNILMELYEYDFSIEDLNIITKYMFYMGLNIHNLTTENNNLIIYLIDNHYYYKPEYVSYNIHFNKLLKTLLNLNVNPNIINIYNNTGILYNFKMILNDNTYDKDNILFDTIDTYLNNETKYGLNYNIQDNNGNTFLHIIMKICASFIYYNDYYIYSYKNNIETNYKKVLKFLQKIKNKINMKIKNNDNKTPFLELFENINNIDDNDDNYKILEYLLF